MSDIEKCIELAKCVGFDEAVRMDAGTVVLHDEVRATCAEGKCHAYGHNWTCPPECGDLDHCRSVVARYSEGVIVQTIGELEDSMDYEAMTETSQRHKKNFTALAEKVRALYPDATCLGAGGCTVCKKCNYPEPCRFPDKAFSSMEGYGMLVSDVCTANNVPYYHGKNTIAFVACYLFA
jgi:predicted metal-binding protein